MNGNELNGENKLITKIELTNFKGAGDTVHIPIRPITLLFGANSAGKSTILHALHLAYEVFINKNFDPDITEKGGDGINLGGFRNFVHNRDLSKKIVLGFELDLSKTDLNTYGAPENIDISGHVDTAKIEITLAWSELENRVLPMLYRVSLNGIFAAELTQPNGFKQGTFLDYNIEHPIVDSIFGEIFLDSSHEWLQIPIANLRTVIPRWGHKLEYVETDGIKFLEHGDLIASQVLAGVGDVFRRILLGIRHIGPIREVIPRNYEGLTSTLESRWYMGLAAWDHLLHDNRTQLVKKVSGWLSKPSKLNTGYSLEVKKLIQTFSPLQTDGETPDQQTDHEAEGLEVSIHQNYVRLVRSETGRKFTLHDVGVGMSQLIPVVVGALMRSTKILAVEQPELHIHPSVQVGLGDLFASQIAERDCLFLIETHSEHLILRLSRRIREAHQFELPDGAPNIKHDDIAILYFENKNDMMEVTSIEIDEAGEFTKRWPKGFFDERAEELF